MNKLCFGLHAAECVLVLGLSVFIFVYHKKRKFQTRLVKFRTGFKNVLPIFIFLFCMLLALTMVLMHSLQHLQQIRLYDELTTSGVTARGKILYRNITCEYYRANEYYNFEMGVSFYDSSGKRQQTLIYVDPFNYKRLSEQVSVWIQYQWDDPKIIIFPDFPPGVDPKGAIRVFSFGLIFVTGVLIWMRRNYVCQSCQELNLHIPIRSSRDLKRVLRMLKRHVGDGTVCVLRKNANSVPFNWILSEGPCSNDLEYLFRCNSCYAEFGLTSRPFRQTDAPFMGQGGNWGPQ